MTAAASCASCCSPFAESPRLWPGPAMLHGRLQAVQARGPFLGPVQAAKHGTPDPQQPSSAAANSPPCQQIDAEHVLVLQTDSVLCGASPHAITDFEHLAYVGCVVVRSCAQCLVSGAGSISTPWGDSSSCWGQLSNQPSCPFFRPCVRADAGWRCWARQSMASAQPAVPLLGLRRPILPPEERSVAVPGSTGPSSGAEQLSRGHLFC